MKQMQQMVTDILFLADLRGWKVKVHADYCLWCGYSLINHTRQPFIHYSLFVIHWSLVFGLWCLVFGLWSLVFGDSKIQEFKDSRIQRFKNSTIRGIKDLRDSSWFRIIVWVVFYSFWNTDEADATDGHRYFVSRWFTRMKGKGSRWLLFVMRLLINQSHAPALYSLFTIRYSLVFSLWSLVFGDSKIQGFKDSKIQRFEESRI